MPGPRFTALPVEEDFFDDAPFRVNATLAIPRAAEEVWSDFTAEHPLAWCRIIDRITWTSPRPFGVGTRRTGSSLKGTSVIEEVFFRWEEGRCQSFYATHISNPLFRRFAEDYLIEPVAPTACRFSWTIAIEPRRGAQVANPLNRMLLGTLFRDTSKHYGCA